MPAGLVRYQQCGEMHFLTFSCYRRLPYLGDEKARCLFESALERMQKRYRFVVAGYVVMPEHVHLLVNEPQRSSLDRAVKGIKLSVALRCAPFIHSFIVDEWESTNLNQPSFSSAILAGVALRSFPNEDRAMPSGLKRFQRAESLHFITFSCFHRFPLLEAAGVSFPTQAAKDAAWMGHNPSRENQK